MPQSTPEETDRWWVAVDQTVTGPYSTGYVAAALRSGMLQACQHFCPVGGKEWRLAGQWPQLAPHCIETPRSFNVPPENQSALGHLLPPIQIVRILAFYALVINPVLWLVNVVITIMVDPKSPPDSVVYQWDNLMAFVGIFFNSIIAAGWLITGYLLNSYDRRSVWMALATYVGSWSLYMFFIILVIVIYQNLEVVEVKPTPTYEVLIDMSTLLIGSIELVFLTLMTVLLVSKRQEIPWRAVANQSR
ncbi:hypothetical protein Plim_3074 [Planctopirus limnophila DSM 3776]|uniref:GYF domain-containing protein n=1 Tax=Planctopirus limnophila (strain ATCC 43296 / DSM 3776 / IFAM 1008 / Mu 290) TaxID=521674 RepID=D5SSU2_PLAL2|nr:hypothetical protein [Planctopirus limnophila]ADG68893.1 hypothetical protein Plim_3074 [Planctopirus limnophila DSM 3776]